MQYSSSFCWQTKKQNWVSCLIAHSQDRHYTEFYANENKPVKGQIYSLDNRSKDHVFTMLLNNIEHTAFQFLSLFSFLSKNKYGATLTKAY